MRAGGGLVGRLTDITSPMGVRVPAADVNRRAIDKMENAGLLIQRVEDLSAQNILGLTVARPLLTQGTVPQEEVQRLDT